MEQQTRIPIEDGVNYRLKIFGKVDYRGYDLLFINDSDNTCVVLESDSNRENLVTARKEYMTILTDSYPNSTFEIEPC